MLPESEALLWPCKGHHVLRGDSKHNCGSVFRLRQTLFPTANYTRNVQEALFGASKSEPAVAAKAFQSCKSANTHKDKHQDLSSNSTKQELYTKSVTMNLSECKELGALGKTLPNSKDYFSFQLTLLLGRQLKAKARCVPTVLCSWQTVQLYCIYAS